MSTPVPHPTSVGPDTLITVKVFYDGQNRRFKLALRDLGAHVLPQKLRFLLQIPSGTDVKFERFSDSAGVYVNLDTTNPSIYKQLYRAAKAKLKLRLRATLITEQPNEITSVVEEKTSPEPSKRNTYFETVLSNPPEIQPFASLVPTVIAQPTIDIKREAMLSKATLPSLNDFCGATFSIDCNHCGLPVADEHYHCSKCEDGDFDLCPTCIGRGVTCNGEDHWLIKRTVKSGKVYSSNTQTLPPKKKSDIPATAAASTVTEEDQRTCNNCIIQLGASSFVTCEQCPDYDLCFFCLEHGEHGHHPAHSFTPVTSTSSDARSGFIKLLCQQGRGLKHEAICDGCDSTIVGVRHKCLSCPDFDFCSTCVQSASDIHPGHRFAPLYEQLGNISTKKEQHRGIYCDGPICTQRARKTYIRGDRYKCAICEDTDFCANCEALPTNVHNKTHPLIKLKTAVRGLSIASVNEPEHGAPLYFGDRPMAKHASTETVRSNSTNAATQVQTVAETTPAEQITHEACEKSIVEPRGELQAWFEHDSTPDGSTFAPNRLVSQSWTLRNPGPKAWPIGCAVHFIGGNDMRNLDDKHPSSVTSMAAANRSNALEETVEAGKTATFNVTLKSPAKEGRAISYWRLKTAEGLPFGHKLWCDITVTQKAIKPVEAPTEVAVEVPTEKAEVAEAADRSQESSQMIFPTLEKESPEASVTDVRSETAAVENRDPSEEQDLLDDLESMALEEEDTEDGFMTDEEYDILDAEDEDFLEASHQAVRK